MVQALYFHKPTCYSCFHVAKQVLIPLKEKHGARFEIAGPDVLTDEGLRFYSETADRLGISKQHQRVPMLVIGQDVLIGGQEIKRQVTQVIDKHFENGGVSWAASPPSDVDVITLKWLKELELLKQLPFWKRVRRHPLENGLAIAILAGMIVVATVITMKLMHAIRKPSPCGSPERLHFAVPICLVILSLGGVAIAGYLSLVHEMGRNAVCFIVGDCNSVLQSEYAYLFGVPVSFLGLSSFLALLLASILCAVPRYSQAMITTVFGMSLLGTFAFIYFTFLEPFIIGAICSWCLASAVTMTTMLLVSARSGLNTIAMFHQPKAATKSETVSNEPPESSTES